MKIQKPTVVDFTNANHTHTGTNSGGTISYLLLAGGTMTGAFIEKVVALSDGATPALDASLGNVFTLSAAGDRTIAVPSNPVDGQKIIIRHTASGGARTLSLNTGAGGFAFGTDLVALLQTESGKTDWIGCIYSAVNSKWNVVAYIQGYA